MHYSRLDRNEDGSPDILASVAVHICENCRQSAQRLTLVPEFEYMGCDDCMEDAMAVLAKEREFLAETGCTTQEAEAFISMKRPIARAGMKSLPEVA